LAGDLRDRSAGESDDQQPRVATCGAERGVELLAPDVVERDVDDRRSPRA